MIVSFSSGSLVTTVLPAASRSSTLCSKSSIEEVSVLKCSTVSLRVGSIGVFPSSSVRLESSSTRSSGFKPSTLFSRAPIPSPTSNFSCFSLRIGSTLGKFKESLNSGKSCLSIISPGRRFSFSSANSSCSLLSTRVSFSVPSSCSTISPEIRSFPVPSSSISLIP